MKKSLFVLSLASLLALTGCHGTKKSSFEDFCKGVDEAEKAPDYKSVKITGKVGDKKVNFTYEIPSSWGGLLDSALDLSGDKYNDAEKRALSIMSANGIGVYTLAEDESYTYYTGAGFRVKAEKFSVEWDKNAVFAKYSGEEATVNAKWVK